MDSPFLRIFGILGIVYVSEEGNNESESGEQRDDEEASSRQIEEGRVKDVGRDQRCDNDAQSIVKEMRKSCCSGRRIVLKAYVNDVMIDEIRGRWVGKCGGIHRKTVSCGTVQE